jgi:hypothetical protein
MVNFKASISRFKRQAEKTGWTYIEIPPDVAEKIKPGNKRSFRAKGKLDNYKFSGVALMPLGGGKFIMSLNAAVRKAIGKGYGAMVDIEIQEDTKPFKFNKDFMLCLQDEPVATDFFQSLAPSHQRYFSKWVDDAKTEPTKVKRISIAITALAKRQSYGEMIRSQSKKGL